MSTNPSETALELDQDSLESLTSPITEPKHLESLPCPVISEHWHPPYLFALPHILHPEEDLECIYQLVYPQ